MAPPIEAFVPDCNCMQFDHLRQGGKLHQGKKLQTDKDFKGVDHDPL
jgi:hypothetical protein